MPVYSMTGYASAQQDIATAVAGAGARMSMEVRSVNGRFLDLSFKLPDELRAQEPAMRERMQARLRRGKVEVRCSIESSLPSTMAPPDAQRLAQLAITQEEVLARFPQAAPLSVADVMRWCGDASDSAVDWSAIAPELTQRVLDALLQARAREGQRLALTLHDQIGHLRALAAQAAPMVPRLVEQARERFLARWREAMALSEHSTSAEERALTEATAFAIRIDVAEELTRLCSHLDELERLLHAGGELGKKLDFLIQELHREANTLGSKSAGLDLTRLALDMKVGIEQMREQVQNIE